jgi:hypothetical protein
MSSIEGAMEQAGEPDWLQYQVSIDARHEANRAATGWFVCAVIALVGAAMSLLWAEVNWEGAALTGGGIGIGTSGYATVLYARAASLGALSVAFAAIGVFRRERFNLLVSYRDKPK